MDGVYNWVKSIVFFLVLITIINNLIGKSSYKKYINLITGMILIILVISPIINVFRIDEKLDYYFSKNAFMVDTENINNNLIKMEQTQISSIMSEYKNQIKAQTEKLLESEGLYISNIEITVDENDDSETFGTIKQINLTAGYTVINQTDSSSKIENIKIDKIKLGDEEKTKDEVDQDHVTPAENNIKKLLSDFYNMEPDNINISIQEH